MMKKTSSEMTLSKPVAQNAIKSKSFPIVGLGGSAGSFHSFESFFMHMPADSGMAFIIIMHLDPNHKGHITELIQNFTPMPVMEVIDGMQIESNHVYVIPPNKDMGIHNRKLMLLKPDKAHGHRQPINYFLQRLAEDQCSKAVGIIFSGMGSDGESGVRMIKEKLGMVMVQDPATSHFNSMPLASIGTNMVDYVLAPAEMPVRLIQYLNHPILTEEITEQAKSEIENATSAEKILMLLRSHTGHDFALYKKSTINRRIERRMAFHQLPDYLTYVHYLRENPQEINMLFNELLIGVTRFLRDEEAFISLGEKMLKLLAHKTNEQPIRVWVAGCSTGEEAYSLAMVLIECLDICQPQRKAPKIQVFATDLDPQAVEFARIGTYHDNIVAYVSPERIERFFVKDNGSYTVRKELREMIVFAQHNLIKDAPFTRLDLLSCRNVMIYLTAELQKKIIPVFHYALNPHAIMFMGPAETIGSFTDMFTAVDPKWKLFERKDGGVRGKMVDFPFHVARPSVQSIRVDESSSRDQKRSAEETFYRLLLENFTSPSVLIDDKGDILFSSGKTGKFLELPSGAAILNIHKMAKEQLRYVIGNIIHQARNKKGVVEIKDVKLKENDQVRLINLKASLLHESSLQGQVMIVFEDKGLLKRAARNLAKSSETGQVNVVEELEKELVYTKQQLNSTIEQMETSLEELKSTNEELQSTNEELQSTNEESLTTKEEMQSLNEELMTINMQYQSKAEELSNINNDMKNLLDATDIGTIFLDNQLEILRFTPQVRKLFNLIPADVGRPIMNIASTFDHPTFENEVKDVIERLAIKEIEVSTKNNEWYKVRIMPYRTLDNFISGAVLTFSLITHYKQIEYRLNALQKYAVNVINTLDHPTLQLDKDLRVLSVNYKFLGQFQIKSQNIIERSFMDFVHTQWCTDQLDEALAQCKETANTKTAYFDLKNSADSKFELVASPFVGDKIDEVLLIMITIKAL
ncbi:MAG: CheR family methyltransferase [Sphingobacteriaceae bacterium]